ncbi:MAG TPA: signal recognition particle-docking protein FtsY [Thermoplasmatales archaeon]|nr:signal recognition particle-docking protein FtsY [Thermoplasmatales archaeon]
MFKFLKKSIKKFEDELEAEIEKELEKELKKETWEEKPPQKKVVEERIERGIEQELQKVVETRKEIEKIIEKPPEKPRRRITIDEKKLDDLLWDLEMSLLEADVALSVIESIKSDIKEELRHIPGSRSDVSRIVTQALKKAVSHVLTSNTQNLLELIDKGEKPFVIMFVGVNGSGKTTAIAKLAHYLKKNGKTVVIAAADTFRAGAIEQLEEHAEKLGVKLIKHDFGADPAAVAFDAIEHAKAKHKDVVLIDTAGRMQTNTNLMEEMEKISRVSNPDLTIFVGDALSGNDAVEQAKRFNEVVGLDGIILTKVDADAKGGAALSIAYTIGKPLLFIGVGQGYDDQIPFDPEWMMKNIFGETSE